jgi:hypothetical protein
VFGWCFNCSFVGEVDIKVENGWDRERRRGKGEKQ